MLIAAMLLAQVGVDPKPIPKPTQLGAQPQPKGLYRPVTARIDGTKVRLDQETLDAIVRACKVQGDQLVCKAE